MVYRPGHRRLHILLERLDARDDLHEVAAGACLGLEIPRHEVGDTAACRQVHADLQDPQTEGDPREAGVHEKRQR